MKFTHSIFPSIRARKIVLGLLVFLSGLFLLDRVSYAINTINEGWRLNSNTVTTIKTNSIGGDCKTVVTPNDGKDRFIPTKTVAEWDSFKVAAPGLGLALNVVPDKCPIGSSLVTVYSYLFSSIVRYSASAGTSYDYYSYPSRSNNDYPYATPEGFVTFDYPWTCSPWVASSCYSRHDVATFLNTRTTCAADNFTIDSIPGDFATYYYSYGTVTYTGGGKGIDSRLICDVWGCGDYGDECCSAHQEARADMGPPISACQ